VSGGGDEPHHARRSPRVEETSRSRRARRSPRLEEVRRPRHARRECTSRDLRPRVGVGEAGTQGRVGDWRPLVEWWEWDWDEGNPRIGSIYTSSAVAPHVRAGLRVRACYFLTRLALPVGHNSVPAPVPAGTGSRPYPRPLGRVLVGMWFFFCSLPSFTPIPQVEEEPSAQNT